MQRPTHPRTSQVRRLARAEEGQAFIELALTLPVLFIILLGSAEFARLLYAGIEVSNAARAGAAYASQNIITASDSTGTQTAAVNDGSDIGLVKPTGLAATLNTLCTCSDGTAATCANAATLCISPAHIREYVQVTTTATMNPIIHVPNLPATYSLQGYSQMQVIQ